MQEDKSKTVPYKGMKGRSRSFEGVIIFVCIVIFAYLAICSLIYFFSKETSVYTVSSGSTSSKYGSQYTALILRDETVIQSPKSGYINFLVADTSSVYVGEDTYVIDESGELSSALEEAAYDQTIISSENLSKLNETIYEFDTSFDPDDYYDTYTFKYKLESQILELINDSVFNSLNENSNGSYAIVTSGIAGVMVYGIDGFEGINVDDIEANSFKKTDYSKTIVKTNDLVSAGSDIYKVIVSDEWTLVFQINDIDVFSDVNSLTIEFLKDGVQTKGDFYTFTRGGNSYGVISLDKYMIRYANDRYIQIKIVDNSVISGLLVPKEAVVERQYFMIPKEYASTGGNTSSYGFFRQITDSYGSQTIEFVIPDIIKSTNDYYYVGTNYFSDGDIIIMPDSSKTYQIAAKENLQGVYVQEAGSAEFRLCEILGENGSYYVVREGTTYGVRLYDQVLRDAKDF